MLNIQKMRHERSKVLAEMRAITQTAEKRTDKKMSDVEEKRWNELRLDIDKRGLEISEAQEQEDQSARDSQCVGSNVDNYAGNTGITYRQSGGGSITNKRTSGKSGNEYRSVFHPDRSPNSDGFKSADEYFKLAFSGLHDERLDKMNEKRQQIVGVGNLGGFSVPESMNAIVFDRALELEIVRPRASMWPMETLEKIIPTWATEDTQSNIAGLEGVWLAELDVSTNQDALLREITLKLKKLGIYCSASREIMSFSTGFGDKLLDIMAKAVSWYLDYAYLRGAGAGQPVGIIPHVATYNQSRETAGSISYLDIVNMFSHLKPGSFENAVWIASQSALPSMMTTASTHAVGTGGSFIPLVKEENGKFTMLGKSLYFSEKMPALGVTGDLLLADFSFYSIGMYKEMFLETSNAPGWTQDFTSFRNIVLTDGQPTFSQVLRQNDGLEVSPFVVLSSAETTTEAP